MDIKVEIKEESCFLDFCSQNERELFTKDPLKKVKIETVTSDCDNDTKIKIEGAAAVVPKFCSQNDQEFYSEHHVMELNKISKHSETETKIEIKEEKCCLERNSKETLYVYDGIEDGKDEDLQSIKSASVYKEGVCCCTSYLFSNEDLENDIINFNIRKGSSEKESGRECENKERDVLDISSKETSVGSETPNGGRIVSMASGLKQNSLLQQCNTNKEDINKENCRSILSCEYRKAHRCNICNKAFPHLSNLKSHKVIHEGIKPHKCNICKKAFACLQYLKSHKLIHQDIKPHRCNICKKSFGRLQYLQSHKLTHEGIKPHKCNICNKSFAHLHYLKTHKFIHEGIKPHKCNICDKSFADLSNLKRHKLIHEGIKPHKCNICNKTFSDLSSVKRHKLLIHQENKSQ